NAKSFSTAAPYAAGQAAIGDVCRDLKSGAFLPSAICTLDPTHTTSDWMRSETFMCVNGYTPASNAVFADDAAAGQWALQTPDNCTFGTVDKSSPMQLNKGYVANRNQPAPLKLFAGYGDPGVSMPGIDGPLSYSYVSSSGPIEQIASLANSP